jgi:hypothetical protein
MDAVRRAAGVCGRRPRGGPSKNPGFAALIEPPADFRCQVFLQETLTQQPLRPEIATTGGSLPRLIVGKKTIIRTRRPGSWNLLDAEGLAILEFLRQRGSTSGLSADKTVRRLLAIVGKPGRFVRLCRVAVSEPLRVRAMLGAIGQQLRRSPRELARLRSTLNPLSKFDSGKLAALKHAAQWQARLERSR